jgi:hypothetical protein
MATYRIELVQTVVETAVVFVEATDAQQAEELALAQVTTGAGAVWKFKDVLDGVEVLSAAECRRKKRRIGLASPFSKLRRRQRPPPTAKD